MCVPCLSRDSLCSFAGAIVWARIGVGYRIENLRKKQFDNAIDLIKQHYFTNDLLMQFTEVGNDSESVDNLVNHFLDIMNDQSSLVLIDETHDDAIAGVLLLSVVNKIDFGRVFSHSDMKRGKAYEDCIEYRNSLHIHVDFFLDYKTNCLLRFYLTCVGDAHRGKDLGFHLYRAGMELARHLRIPIACGIFTDERGMALAKRVGFEIVDAINYGNWFNASGNNEQMALMVAKVPKFYVTPIIYAEKTDKKPGKKDKKKKNKKKGKGKKKK